MKLTDAQGNTVHICDFCGMSARGNASIFVSQLTDGVAVCKPCVDAAPFVLGKVTVRLSSAPRVAVEHSFGEGS